MLFHQWMKLIIFQAFFTELLLFLLLREGLQGDPEDSTSAVGPQLGAMRDKGFGGGVWGWGHKGVSGTYRPVIGPPLHSPHPAVWCKRALVEHYGLGILVCHLGHVTEDIFFCDDSKEAPV